MKGHKVLTVELNCCNKLISFLIIFCIFLGFAISEPCAVKNQLRQDIDGMADKLDYDACGSFGENPGLPFEEFLGGEMGSNYVQRNTPTISGLKSVCANSELFCFPSTLHAVLGEEGKHKVSSVDMFEIQDDPLEGNSSWLGGRGTYTLLNGNVVSCSFNPGIKPHDLPSSQGESASQSDSDSGEGHSLKYHRPFNILDKKSELVASDILDGSSSPKIEKLAEPDEEVLRNWRSQGTSRSGSVLDHEEVVYPVVQVGSYSSKWITVKNPSEQPVLMQLILNSGTVIDRCRSIEELEQPLSTGLVHNDSSRPSKHGFSIVATAKSEAYVHPHGEAQLGPILFHPSNRCGWRGSALIRNNLSGVEWISLKGVGGSFSLILLDDSSKTIKGLEFNLNIWDPVQISPKESLHFKENLTSSCSLSLSKEFRVMNTGDLASEVRKIEVSGTQCGLVDGFTVHTCDGFTLQPGESRTLRISYKTVFSSSIVHRDLELALTNGIFVIPMKASVPISMLNVCRKSFWRLLLKKLSLLVFVAACLAFIGFSFLLPKVTTVYKAQDCYLFKSENGTIRRATNNIITLKRAVRENETSKLGFVGRYSDCSNPSGSGVEEQTPRVVQDKVIGILEAETDTHLTVRVKSSKRRRKRRSGGNGSNAGKSGLLEVSSSQSGNSTPSSPMSPLLSFASRSTSTSWSLSPESEHGIESSNPFCKTAIHNQVIKEKVSPQQKPSPTRKVPSKPVLLPSATFPSANQRVPDAVNAPQLLRSTSSINPNARAPGSNLRDRGVKREEKKDKFTYDIWGNHFSGIHLMDKAEEISTMMISDVSDGNSLSFFVMGPQILTRKSRDSSFPCTINSPRQNG
ncbi:hypothetical protein ACHQM5_023723 [Ranunculus cassubicifolius]